MMKIGIDLGGTFIKAGITDDNNNIIISGKAPTGLPCPAEQVVENCAKLAVKENIKAGKYLLVFTAVNILFLAANLILWIIIK